MKNIKRQSNLNIYTIAYSESIAADVEPGYLVLDHTKNIRSDWREYWPIRQYLLSNKLDENAYYGFFSPRFREKTELCYGDLVDFISSFPCDTDVFTFSPQVDMGAFFQNVFYGGELMSPGFIDVSQRLFDRNAVDVSLGSLVMDSRNIVFSNYVVAKPSYWKKWLEIGEMVFAAAECEVNSDRIGQCLRYKTPYPGAVERKVFVIEALASLVLSLNKHLKVINYDPFSLKWSRQLGEFRDEAVICDALKIADTEQKNKMFSGLFRKISHDVLRKANLMPKDSCMTSFESYDQPNQTILDLIPGDVTKVVEIGCKRGSLAKEYLAKNKYNRWVGIESDKDCLQAAAHVCDQVHHSPLGCIDENILNMHADADVWVLDGVLERLDDPLSLFASIKKYLKAGAKVIVSVKNAQHWSNQLSLCSGAFRHEKLSPDNASCPHLFTRSAVFDTINNSGLRIDQAISISLGHPNMEELKTALTLLSSLTGTSPEVNMADAVAYQFVISASLH